MQLPDKWYDVLKWLAMIALPAIAALYLTLSQIWGLPYGEEITRTITAVNACLGAFLGLSTVSYQKTNATDSK